MRLKNKLADIPRLKAMLKQCLTRNCSCIGKCQVKELVRIKHQQLKDALSSQLGLLNSLRQPAATVREDWVFPTPPNENFYLAAYNEGSEWILHWASYDDENDIIEIDDWPFKEDSAKISDWQNLGIIVI